jgi:hypothetical protein
MQDMFFIIEEIIVFSCQFSSFINEILYCFLLHGKAVKIKRKKRQNAGKFSEERKKAKIPPAHLVVSKTLN